MKQINSVLLPGEFFKNNFKEKTEKLMSIDIDTCYLFDHGVNPASKDLDVYEFIDGIYKLNEVINIDANDKIDSISQKIIEKLGLN